MPADLGRPCSFDRAHVSSSLFNSECLTILFGRHYHPDKIGRDYGYAHHCRRGAAASVDGRLHEVVEAARDAGVSMLWCIDHFTSLLLYSIWDSGFSPFASPDNSPDKIFEYQTMSIEEYSATVGLITNASVEAGRARGAATPGPQMLVVAPGLAHPPVDADRSVFSIAKRFNA